MQYTNDKIQSLQYEKSNNVVPFMVFGCYWNTIQESSKILQVFFRHDSQHLCKFWRKSDNIDLPNIEYFVNI